MAIDQILRLAPSISGPIEPVVSSTKRDLDDGLQRALEARHSGDASGGDGKQGSEQAGSTARSALSEHGITLPEKHPTRRMISLPSRLSVARIAAGHRRIRRRILTAALRRQWLPRKSVGNVVPIAA